MKLTLVQASPFALFLQLETRQQNSPPCFAPILHLLPHVLPSSPLLLPPSPLDSISRGSYPSDCHHPPSNPSLLVFFLVHSFLYSSPEGSSGLDCFV